MLLRAKSGGDCLLCISGFSSFILSFLSDAYGLRNYGNLKESKARNRSLLFPGGPRPASTANCTVVMLIVVVICVPPDGIEILFSFHAHYYNGYYTRMRSKYQEIIKGIFI